jgi:hypothetical protein
MKRYFFSQYSNSSGTFNVLMIQVDNNKPRQCNMEECEEFMIENGGRATITVGSYNKENDN